MANEEHFQRASVEFTHSSNQLRDDDLFLPGISMHAFPEVIDESLPFLPISETDMMIREEVLTDLEFYRYNLIMNLKKLEVEEEPLFDMSVEDLRDMVYFTLKDMTVEEYRFLTLRHLERSRDVINDIDPNAMGGINSRELDMEIERLRNMESERVRFLKYDGITRLLNVDMEMMEDQSSISLVKAIMHEIGHGFGLNHIPPRRDEPRPLMEENIYTTLSDLTVPKEIDFYAIWGMFCLYEDILSVN